MTACCKYHLPFILDFLQKKTTKESFGTFFKCFINMWPHYWNSSLCKLNVLLKGRPANTKLSTWHYTAKYAEICIKYTNKTKQPRPPWLMLFVCLLAVRKSPGTRVFSPSDDSGMTPPYLGTRVATWGHFGGKSSYILSSINFLFVQTSGRSTFGTLSLPDCLSILLVSAANVRVHRYRCLVISTTVTVWFHDSSSLYSWVISGLLALFYFLLYLH